MSVASSTPSNAKRVLRLLPDGTTTTTSQQLPSSPRNAKRRLTDTDAVTTFAIVPTPMSKRQKKMTDALDHIMGMCKGEIIPRIPNLQLFHFMTVYGHCGGSQGVCMDSTLRIARIQCKIYEKHVNSMTQNLSSANSNNGQSKFVPNDWIDTFCKLLVDINIGMPRIQSLMDTLRKRTEEEGGGGAAPSWKLNKEVEAVAAMMKSGCTQCYERRMVDLSSLKHPETAVARFFPTAQLFAGSRDQCAEALRRWACNLMAWVCGMYENSCYCCFEDLPAAESILRVPTPRHMGITSTEFQVKKNEIIVFTKKTNIVVMRLRCTIANFSDTRVESRIGQRENCCYEIEVYDRKLL